MMNKFKWTVIYNWETAHVSEKSQTKNEEK